MLSFVYEIALCTNFWAHQVLGFDGLSDFKFFKNLEAQQLHCYILNLQLNFLIHLKVITLRKDCEWIFTMYKRGAVCRVATHCSLP